MKPDMREQFVQLYEQEADALFRFCLVRVHDRHVAIDLVQETFLRYLQTACTKHVTHTRALLFKILRNLIIDWYRKRKPTSLEAMNNEDTGETYEVPDDSIPDQLRTSDALQALEHINKLTPAYREVLYLRFVEDLKPQEIAEVMSLPVNLVLVRINRGLEALRTMLHIEKQ